MGKLGGFLEFERIEKTKREIDDRVKDWKDLYKPLTPEYLEQQAARCMDCGIPFCHTACPLGNLCPEWNDFVHKGEWKEALEVLSKTNNFPEFTGTLCPALCEGGCVLGINEKPVTIKNIELSIAEKGWEEGWIIPQPPKVRTGKKVAVVGSGPSGLATAQQLNRKGHSVTVYEKDDKAGGIMAYGIPDFKIEKTVIARRVNQLVEEGIEFVYNTNVGVDLSVEDLKASYDSVVLCGGSRLARDLPVYGRELNGVHYAMDYLMQQNKKVAGKEFEGDLIDAKGKNVLVIGGGDTGSDCVGTATRQGAKSVLQIELLEKPTEDRKDTNPWPAYPQVLKTSTSHQEAIKFLGGVSPIAEEGDVRAWNIMTKEFIGDDKGNLKEFKAIRVEWEDVPGGRPKLIELPATEFKIDIDLVFLAIGFVHPEHEGLVKNLGLELDQRGNVQAINYATNVDGVYAAGDMRRGQSLIVRAIAEGREAAEEVDKYLMK